MTEAEWLARADPGPMLEWLHHHKASDRKLRLFACACCRRVWEWLPDEASRRAIEVTEQYADAHAQSDAHRQAEAAAHAVRRRKRWDGDLGWRWFAARAACYAASEDAWLAASEGASHVLIAARSDGRDWAARRKRGAIEGNAQCNLLRDIYGPMPFREDRIEPAWLHWNDRTVVRLAAAIYEERRFGDMPVLADALEDAGCDEPEILGHCRGPGPHVRGCWVVDLLLGKS